jgi:Phage capsid scaffolding protein (GPO) serine peptidase.
MAKTRFFRVAVEGATTDGRTISRDWIEQMAAGYDPATYTARINCEHIKGFSPEPPFNAYGSVTALKAEEIELALDGKPVKRLALFAQLDANDQLVSTVRAGQKVFTSIEVSPNFAQTGKAGLVGLAVTDTPASLGVEALSFSALKPMFDARKSAPDNLFTAATEADITLEETSDAPPADAFAAFAAKFGALIERITGKGEPQKPASDAALPDMQLSALRDLLAEFSDAATRKSEAQDGAIAALREELSALKAHLETTERPQPVRAPATGSGTAILTDC